MKEKKEKLAERIVLVIVANLILALGTSLLRLSGFGTDPFACMNLGVSSHLPISYGTYQMLLNIVLFIPIFFLDRQSFGVGALVNMFALGYFVEFHMMWMSLIGLTVGSISGLLAFRIVLMVIGILVICFGVALYMGCDLGAAPYDRLGVVVERYSSGRIKYRYARIASDLVSMLVGYLSGSTVGIATVVVGFFTGPLISLCRDTIVDRIMKRL